jgi:hypothetical protein
MNIDIILAPLVVWNLVITIILCAVWVRRGLPAVNWVERRRRYETEQLERRTEELTR